MSTITKERAQQIFLGNGPEPTASEERELARIALASIEAEPVGYIDAEYTDLIKSAHIESCSVYSEPGEGFIALYAAPPAPVSVPDERYQHLSELYHAQEKRLFKLAQRIKGASFDKYAYSPSQAIDVLESAIFGEREDECRAAMLQAGTLTNEGTIPVTQFKPVADLYGLTSPTGGETSFTFDAVEARDFIDGGWSCQEYVELERFQEAVSGNSPVIPDGWVACSERMPDDDDFVYIWPRPDFGVELHVGQYCECHPKGDGWYAQVYEQNYGIEWCPITVTHWMPLPAAPQQEVK